jgi:hypothetical protein
MSLEERIVSDRAKPPFWSVGKRHEQRVEKWKTCFLVFLACPSARHFHSRLFSCALSVKAGEQLLLIFDTMPAEVIYFY